MIKLLLVSWVQVFITFLLAYFCADYSKMISIMFESFHLTQLMQNAAAHVQSARCWRDAGVAHTHMRRK